MSEELLNYNVGAAATVDCAMITESNTERRIFEETFPRHAMSIADNVNILGTD